MTEDKIEQLFDDNFDCYADIESMVEIPAMTKEKFVETVRNQVKLQSNPQIAQKNTKIFTMQLHQTIDLQDKEGLEEFGYLPYRYITRVFGGWIYSNYDIEKDMYVPNDKMFVPIVKEF